MFAVTAVQSNNKQCLNSKHFCRTNSIRHLAPRCFGMRDIIVGSVDVHGGEAEASSFVTPCTERSLWVFCRTLLCGVECSKIEGMIVMSSIATKAPFCNLFFNHCAAWYKVATSCRQKPFPAAALPLENPDQAT